MHGSYRLMFLFVGFLVLSSACGGGGGGGGGGPTAPSVANIAGLWNGTATIGDASGCGCVSTTYNNLARGSQLAYTDQITQNGSSITGRTTHNDTGLWCDYTGTVSSSSWSRNATQCNVTYIAGFRCSNGNWRDLSLVALTDQGTVSGNVMTGDTAETWNCFNSSTGAGVGVLTLRTSLRQTR